MFYSDLVRSNASKAEFYFIKIIDNKTLQVHYSILTNLHLDYGVCDNLFSHFRGSSWRKYRKRVQEIKQAGNYKVKLFKTDNDANYTRLVYKTFLKGLN